MRYEYVFYAFILPLFEYCCNCCNSWSNCSQNIKDILIKQDKKMARVIVGADVRTPTHDVLNRLHWVHIEDRWKFHKCKMVYHALSEQSPLYLSDMFVHVRSHSLHNHRTRSAANMGLIIPKSRTQMGKRRFSHEAAAYWNQLPNIVRQAPSKKILCKSLLENGSFFYHDLLINKCKKRQDNNFMMNYSHALVLLPTCMKSKFECIICIHVSKVISTLLILHKISFILCDSCMITPI